MHCKPRGTGQILKVVFVCILMILVLSKYANAKVSGVCSNCHTMHNSQNGSNMRLDYSKAQISGSGAGECLDCHAETRAVLLQLDCLGCHATNPSGGANIVGGWPQVAHNAGTDLAGGNYRNVFGGNNTRGHNVHGFGAAVGSDFFLANTPPGYNSSFDPASTKYDTVKRLQCAGSNGCHGNRNQVSPILAIRGTHHADDSMLKFGAGFRESTQGDPASTGNAGTSYRFLYKVHGAEDSDWEATLTATDHNEYKGGTFASRPVGSMQWSDVNTISEFCAECHGIFHEGGNSGIGSASPWLRHPTDVILPSSGEYTAYTAYNTEAPVARQNIADGTTQALGTVAPGTDIVMCLSCHRAHASPYPDILRWDYSNMGKGRGCYICHTQKDDNL